MFKKAKIVSLLFIVVASTIVGLADVNPAYAQQQTDKDPKQLSGALTQDLKNDIYGNLMRQCLILGQAGKPVGNPPSIYQYPISKDDIASGDWLKKYTENNSIDKSAIKSGYIVDPSGDGKLSCDGDSQAIISGYKTAAGITSSDPYTVICSLGFRPVKSVSKTDPYPFIADNGMSVDECAKMASNGDVYGYKLDPNYMDGTDYTIDPAEQYIAYSYTLFNICKPTSGTPLGSTLADVPVVYMDGTKEDITYYMPSGSGEHKAGWDVSVSFNEKYTCEQLPDKMRGTFQAYIDWLGSLQPQDDKPAAVDPNAGAGGGENEKSNCQVDGIGWIVCPIVTFLSEIIDKSYVLLNDHLLQTPPLKIDDPEDGLYKSWAVMRDIANVAFVIAFLIIVFSQITSMGVSNYGIKKLLPKIVMAAIAVNISFYVCALAVDLSNILGNSLKELLDTGVASKITESPSAMNDSFGKTGWTGLAGEILAGGLMVGTAVVAEVYLALSVFIPLLFAAITAVLTVLIVLTLRQVLIILLIVMSPLAFVALLLPNTEQYFKRWRQLFEVMLLMYPIIAIIFGGCALASQIIMNSSTVWSVQLMGAGASVIPLFITPIVMKAAGGILGRVTGIVNNPNKGLIDRARKESEGYRKDMMSLRDTEAMKGKGVPGGKVTRWKSRRNAIRASRESALKYNETKYISDEAAANDGDNKFARQMAGETMFTDADEGAQNAVVAHAEAQLKKAFQEDVANMEVRIRTKFDNNPEDALTDAIERGDKAQAVAAQNLLFQRGGSGISAFRDIIQQMEQSPDSMAKLDTVGEELRENLDAKHGQAAKAKGADLVKWATASKPTMIDDNGNEVQNPNHRLTTASAGQMSDVDVAGQHVKSVAKMIGQNQISHEQAQRMLTDPRISANLEESKKQLLSQIPAPTPPPTPATAREFTRAQVQTMGPQNVQAAVQARGGMEAMHQGDVITIANVHGTHEVGQQARDEVSRRGISTGTRLAGPRGRLP